MSNRGVAFSVARGGGHVVITVPSAYRLWPGCQPDQRVPIRWGEEGLVLASLPGQPVVTLTTTQRDRLRNYLDGQAGLPFLMEDPHGRYRIVGHLPSEEASDG